MTGVPRERVLGIAGGKANDPSEVGVRRLKAPRDLPRRLRGSSPGSMELFVMR